MNKAVAPSNLIKGGRIMKERSLSLEYGIPFDTLIKILRANTYIYLVPMVRYARANKIKVGYKGVAEFLANKNIINWITKLTK